MIVILQAVIKQSKRKFEQSEAKHVAKTTLEKLLVLHEKYMAHTGTIVSSFCLMGFPTYMIVDIEPENLLVNYDKYCTKITKAQFK